MDLIALIFFCRYIGRLATRKGLPAFTWQLYTAGAWIGAEILGILLGVAMFGLNMDDMLGLGLLGLISAVGGGLIIKATLDKKPDLDDDDINRIGSDDLRPPSRL